MKEKDLKITKKNDDKERLVIERKSDRVVEEQKIVDNVILKIEDLMNDCDKKKSIATKKFEHAKDSVAEAYGVLIENREQISKCIADKEILQNAKKTLYKSRLRLKIEDLERDNEKEDGIECEKIVTNSVIRGLTEQENSDVEEVEILVGEHECGAYLDRIIYSWLNPICRNYVLLENVEDFIFRDTKYSLSFKRDIVLMNKKVMEVVDKYPKVDNADDSIYYEIADPFLRKLQSKRGEKELSNIIFSIQKQQSQIVMTPYDKNIIVQGCAGSGKSMIMLHRLPVLLYDNKNTLKRKQVVVITPSQLYIRAAQSLLDDLEIEDIYIDIMQEYYSKKIDMYENGEYKNDIPKHTSRKNIDKKIITYVYSTEIEKLIINYFVDKKEKIVDVMNEVYSITGSSEDEVLKGFSNGIKDKWRKYMIYLSKLVEAEEKEQNSRSLIIKDLVENAKKLQIQIEKLCPTYKNALLKKEEQYTKNIYKLEHSKRALIEKNGEKAKSYKRFIGYEEDIENYTYIRNEIQKALRNLSENIVLRKQIEFYAEHLDGIIKEYESDDRLSFLEEEFIIKNIERVLNALYSVKFLNEKQAEEFKCVANCLQSMKDTANVINNIKEKYKNMLLATEYITVKSAYEEVKYEYENVVQDAYEMVIEELREFDDGLNTTVRYDFTYYLYLQVIYNFNGKLLSGFDKMIMIDEAQNFSIAELRLINNINDGVIFNLYGDIKQHIEVEKGLNSWNDLENIDDYEVFELNQNYRNVNQITEYCNSRFNMDMQPVNLEGKDVYTYKKESISLDDLLEDVLSNKENDYRLALVVKNMKENLKDIELNKTIDKINKVRTRRDTIDCNKINLIAVEDAKGIEFDIVVVMKVEDMSQNEEYIACTRALEELVIYDCTR